MRKKNNIRKLCKQTISITMAALLLLQPLPWTRAEASPLQTEALAAADPLQNGIDPAAGTLQNETSTAADSLQTEALAASNTLQSKTTAAVNTPQPGDVDWSRAQVLTLTTEEASRYTELGGDLSTATPDSVRDLLGSDAGGSALGEDGLAAITETLSAEGLTPLTEEPGELEMSYYLENENGDTAVLDQDELLSAVSQAQSAADLAPKKSTAQKYKKESTQTQREEAQNVKTQPGETPDVSAKTDDVRNAKAQPEEAQGTEAQAEEAQGAEVQPEDTLSRDSENISLEQDTLDGSFLALADQALVDTSWTPVQSVVVLNQHQIGFTARLDDAPISNVHFYVEFFKVNENGIKAENTPTYVGEFQSANGSAIFGPAGDAEVNCPVGGSLAGKWAADIYVKTPDTIRDACMTNVLVSGGSGTDIRLAPDDGSLYFAGVTYEVTDLLNNSDKILVSPYLDTDKTFSVWLQQASAQGEVQVELFQENADRTELYSIGTSAFAAIPGGSHDPVCFTLKDTWCTKLKPARRVGFRVLDREGNTLAVSYPNVGVEKAVVDRPTYMDTKLGLFGDLAGGTIPEDVPAIGGGKAGINMPNFPFQVNIGLDGSAMIGVNINVMTQTGLNNETPDAWKHQTLRENAAFHKTLASNFKSALANYNKAKGKALDSRMKIGTADIGYAKVALYGMGLLQGNYDPVDGYVYASGSILVQLQLNASIATQIVVVVVPVYVGLDISASGGVQGNLAMRFLPSDFAGSFELLGNQSGLSLTSAIELGIVAGIGVRNLCSVDAKGYVGINMTMPLLYGADLGKIRLYAGARISATALFFYYEKTLCHAEVDLYGANRTSLDLARAVESPETQWLDLTTTDAFRENILTRENEEGDFTTLSSGRLRGIHSPDYITEEGQQLFLGTAEGMSPGARPQVTGDTLSFLANVQLADGTLLTLPHRAALPRENGELGTPEPLISPDLYAAKFGEDACYVYDFQMQDVKSASGQEDTLVIAAARGTEAGDSPDTTATTVIISRDHGQALTEMDYVDGPAQDVGIAPSQDTAPYVVTSYYNPESHSIVAGLLSKSTEYKPFYRPDRQRIRIPLADDVKLIHSIPAGCYPRYVDRKPSEYRAGEPLYWTYHIPYGYYVEERADGKYALMCWDLSAWDGQSDYSKVTPRIQEVLTADELQDLWSCARYNFTETYFRSGNTIYVTHCSDEGATCQEYMTPEGMDLSAYTLSYSIGYGDVRVMAMSVIDPTGGGTVPEEDRAPGVEQSTTLYIWRQDSQTKIHEPRKIRLPGYVCSASQLTVTQDDTIRALLYNYEQDRSTLDILVESPRTNIDMTSCETLSHFVGEKEPIRFRASFRNQGTTEVREVTMGLYDADRLGTSTPLALMNVDLFNTSSGYRNFLPGDEVTADFTCICPSAWTSGTHSFYLRVIDETASPVDTLETQDRSIRLDVSHWAENTPKANLWLRRIEAVTQENTPPAETLKISLSDDGETWTTWKTLDMTREFIDTRTLPAQTETLTLNLTEASSGVTPFSGTRANYAQIRYEYYQGSRQLLLGDFYLGGGLYGMPVRIGDMPLTGSSDASLVLKTLCDAELYHITLPDGTVAQVTVDGHLFDGSILDSDGNASDCPMAALTFTTDYEPKSTGDGMKNGYLDLLAEEPQGFPMDVTVGETEYTIHLRKGENVTINVPASYLNGGSDDDTDLDQLLGGEISPSLLNGVLTQLDAGEVQMDWSDPANESYCVLGSSELTLEMSEFADYYRLTLRNDSITQSDTRLAVYADDDTEPFLTVDKSHSAEALGDLNCVNAVTVVITKADLATALNRAGKSNYNNITFVAETREFTQDSMNQMLAGNSRYDASARDKYAETSVSNSIVVPNHGQVWVLLHGEDPSMGQVTLDGRTGANVSAGYDILTEGVTIEAVPGDGAHFLHWKDSHGEIVSAENPYTLPQLEGHVLLYAVFEEGSEEPDPETPETDPDTPETDPDTPETDPEEDPTEKDFDPWALFTREELKSQTGSPLEFFREKGLLEGIPEEAAASDSDCSRAVFCRILYNLAGQPAVRGKAPFTDVEPDSRYADAVTWAAAEDIMTAAGSGLFCPEEALTQGELALTLYSFEKEVGGLVDNRGSSAVHRGNAKANIMSTDGVQWFKKNKFTDLLSKGKFDTEAEATCEQIAQVLKAYLLTK